MTLSCARLTEDRVRSRIRDGRQDTVPIGAMFQNRWHHWMNVVLASRLGSSTGQALCQPGALEGWISPFNEFGGIDRTRRWGNC